MVEDFMCNLKVYRVAQGLRAQNNWQKKSGFGKIASTCSKSSDMR